MKITHRVNRPALLLCVVAAVVGMAGVAGLHAQGTVSFDHPWLPAGVAGFSLGYFDGMSFRVSPYPPQPHDDVMLVGASGVAGHPNNATPHAEFNNTLGIPQDVLFSLTDAASLGHSFTNGAPFGLTSVDLADAVAPSLSPVSITFNGFRADGSMVSETFTTPGSGSSFQTYYFDADFASGVVRVQLPSPAWAMDNIVFTVPEPSAAVLLSLGLLGFVLRKRAGHAACAKANPPEEAGTRELG